MIKLSRDKSLNFLLITTLFIFIYVISITGCKEKANSILNEDKLYGKVKNKIECSYYAKKQLWRVVKSDTFYEKTKSTYDEKGHKIEETGYNATFNNYSKYIYKYDGKGKQIESNTLNPDGTISNKFFYKYDSINNTMESYSENYFYKSYFKFDSRGYSMEEICHRGGRLDSKKTWKYDSSGNMIEANTYDVDGNLVDSYLCRYNNEGNLLESKHFDETGSLVSVFITEWDDYGNPVNEFTHYPADKRLSYQYSYQYEYDDSNNWIKRIDENIKDGTYKIVERKIEYYK